MTEKTTDPAAALATFAATLAAETAEIDGTDLRLGGVTYLVTTEAQIREWIGWHLHAVDVDVDEQGRPVAGCACGWVAGPCDDVLVVDVADGHRAEGIAAIVAAKREG